MSGFTCAKCGAFGLSDEPGECGFPNANGVRCDGERTFSPEQLRHARAAVFAEMRATRLDAEITRLRAALSAIAALQPTQPSAKPNTSAGFFEAFEAGEAHGVKVGHFEAAEMARAALRGEK